MKDGQTAGAVAKEWGLVEQTLRNGVKVAAAGKLSGAGAKGVTPEERAWSRLRAENIRLKRELEIIKKRRRTSRGRFCEVRLDGGANRHRKRQHSTLADKSPIQFLEHWLGEQIPEKPMA